MIAVDRVETPFRFAVPPPMYCVWIDTNLGDAPPDWEMSTHPKPLQLAEMEADELRREHWPVLILPEGRTPRSDGLFTNPEFE